MSQGVQQTSIFVLGALAIVLTFAWIAVHGAGLYLYLRRGKDAPPPSRLSVVAWLVSFGGGFFGPLVILANLVSLILGIVALMRNRGENASPATRSAAGTAIVASLVIQLMAVLIASWVVVWMLVVA